MNTWIIEPRDPLIVRDGRPFGPTPGARAASLTFPFPSTTTGGVRTRDGLDTEGRFQESEIPRVEGLAVEGPILVSLDEGGEIAEWFAPAPADALVLEKESGGLASSPTNVTGGVGVDANQPVAASYMLKRLVPLEAPTGARTNLPHDLSLVGMPKPDPSKPCTKAPRYWNCDRFMQWLRDPGDQDNVSLEDLGIHGPEQETRTHVSIQQDTQTNVDGALFQTRGLEFTEKDKRTDKRTRLALAVATDAPNLKEGLAPLGGERRLVQWRQSSKSLPPCPEAIRNNIRDQKHCRVILLTPAHFREGWKPQWLCNPSAGVTATVEAIALPRYQVVSGWDFKWKDPTGKIHGRPKPTRRLAPAGTTLFLKLDGDESAIEEWIEKVWMKCVSDEVTDQRDGFGLAVLGVWDGCLKPLEVK